MRGLLTCVHVLNFVVLAVFLLYIPWVWLGFTFTFSDLTDDDVRFYISDDDADDTEKASGRFGLYWWVFGTSILRLTAPFLAILALVVIVQGAPWFTIFVQIWVVLLVVWELVKFVWLLILWFPKNCKHFQFCRNQGARRDDMGNEIGADPALGNIFYEWEVWFSLAWFVVLLFYLGVISAMEGSLVGIWKWEKRNGKQSKKRDPPSASIVWTLVILNSLLLLAFIFYFPLVYFDFTFTTTKETPAAVAPDVKFNLPDESVPFYVSDDAFDPTEGSSGRGQLYWWIYWSDIFIILVPFAAIGNLAERAYRYRGCTPIIQLYLLLVAAWLVVKFVWISVLSVPSICETHQFCRDFGARRIGGAEVGDNPANMNFVYSIYLWFNLGFLLFVIADLLAVSLMKKAALKEQARRMLLLGTNAVKKKFHVNKPSSSSSSLKKEEKRGRSKSRG